MGLRGICVRGCGHVSGVMVVVVMAWGCGDIPFLADGNYGVVGSWGMRWNFS